jgi:hypothetical protein
VREARDLRKARIAVAFGDAAELYFRQLLSNHGIPESELSIEPFRFDLTRLIAGEVDAVTGFSTDQPFTLEKQGITPVILPYHSLGQRGYGYMFVAKSETRSDTSALYSRFLRASRRGWVEAFSKSQASLELAKNHFLPNLDLIVELRKLEALRAIMLEGGSLATWTIEPAVMEAANERMAKPSSPRGLAKTSEAFDNAAARQAEAK